MVNRERMKAQLILHEGIRLKPYKCTAGKWTIGVGYNYQDRGLEELEEIIGRKFDPSVGITRSEALRVLDIDISRYEAATRKALGPAYYDKLNEVRQRVCVDMAFNLGYRALSFKNTIAAVKRGDYALAAYNMMKSLWATQVGDGPGKRYDRAERLSDMMLTGRDYHQ